MQEVLAGGVQILRLTVTGSGYIQKSRVQFLGRKSDISISGPEGEEPRQSVRAIDLATGRPVIAYLQPHAGSLTVQQRLVENTTAATASPASLGASAEWLKLTLSCAAPPTAVSGPHPQ
jgi:hypothetical protein